MQLDDTDRKLIVLLAQNARTPVSELGRRLGIARTTVQARIDRLVTNKVIAGFTIRKGEMLKSAIRATVMICVEPNAGASVLSRLKTLAGIETVHTVSGRVDMIVEVSSPSTEALDFVLDQIGQASGVKSSESLIHLSTKIERSG